MGRRSPEPGRKEFSPELTGRTQVTPAEQPDRRHELRRNRGRSNGATSAAANAWYDPLVTHPQRIGRFRVLGFVGRGAMGVVYQGRDDALERNVALKVMSIGLGTDAEARGRFLREAKAVARLQHPNIVTVYELGEHEGAP